MRPTLRLSLIAVPLSALFTVGAVAALFPDVPTGHIYNEPIEALATAGVVKGNPDGTFAPERKVNRAEMLKMLYMATGKQPDASSRACFTDVERLSWYESYICDAAAHHYVEGYSDGTFRPGNSVNRVEALKMVMQVFGIPAAEVGEQARQVVKFVDVSISAWYTKYLYAAYTKGILPIAGQDASRLYPDWPLLRGEAAAMIFNGLRVDLTERRKSESSISSAVSSQNTSTGVPIASEASSKANAVSEFEVPFPFESAGKFSERKSLTYAFALDHAAVVETVVSLQQGQQGAVSCRLYLMAESGFSFEYFLGFQEGNDCTIKSALRPGSYRLQLQPTFANTTFSVKSNETKTGDGSDGFTEVQTLPMNLARTGTLAPSDIQDFYTFTINGPQSLNVTVSDSTQITCLIYPMESVDLYGFSGPACNQHYEFQPGTYVVAVGRKSPIDARQTYTIVVQ